MWKAIPQLWPSHTQRSFACLRLRVSKHKGDVCHFSASQLASHDVDVDVFCKIAGGLADKNVVRDGHQLCLWTIFRGKGKGFSMLGTQF